MATFQLFFQSDRAKDLSAPLYILKSVPGGGKLVPPRCVIVVPSKNSQLETDPDIHVMEGNPSTPTSFD